MIVYVSIGNSDDGLSQSEWAEFVADVQSLLGGVRIHGEWFSLPHVKWQNACWCIEVHDHEYKEGLRLLAIKYRQRSIAWAVAPIPQFIGKEDTHGPG